MFLWLIIIGIFFWIDYYVWQAVKTAFLPGIHNTTRWFIGTFYWGFNCVAVGVLLWSVLEMRRGNPMHPAAVWIGNIWFALFIAKLIVLALLFGEDLWRILVGSYVKLTCPASVPDSGFMPERRKFVSQLALGLAAIPFGSFIYGMVKGRYNYKVYRHVLTFDDLPRAFDGFTITQVSDIHAGSFESTEGVAAGIKIMEDLKSDLFVFTGDLINAHASEMDRWLPLFKRIPQPEFGKFSILGNHDYGEYTVWKDSKSKEANFNALLHHHAALGFTLLRNRSVPLTKDGQTIYLVGVENWGRGFGQRGDLEQALAAVPKDGFKILLSHDPSHWDELARYHPAHIHLTLSGHTHGMQMGIEIPGFRWSPIQYRYPQWAGLYEHHGRWLNVNRGFGVLGFRTRVGIWPEITQIVLKKS